MKEYKTSTSLNNQQIRIFFDGGLNITPPENYTTTQKIDIESTAADIPVTSSVTSEAYNDSSIESEESTIQKNFAQYRKRKVDEYSEEILSIFMNDEFIDGEVSQSEIYMEKHFNENTSIYILEALNNILVKNFDIPHILEGVLTMLSSISYKAASPEGISMCVSLLEHKSLAVKDKAVQTFERWNSKEAITILENLNCSPIWFQNYINDVISALKEGGND